MVNKFSDAINISLRAYARERAALPKKLGNEAVNHFKDNWRKQGFDDSYVNKWKQRKRQTRLTIGRAILVGKTGNLRKQFNISSTINRATVTNYTPYSVYHNYGTTRLPQRKFMGRSKNLDKKSGVLIMRMIKRALR